MLYVTLKCTSCILMLNVSIHNMYPYYMLYYGVNENIIRAIIMLFGPGTFCLGSCGWSKVTY